MLNTYCGKSEKSLVLPLIPKESFFVLFEGENTGTAPAF